MTDLTHHATAAVCEKKKENKKSRETAAEWKRQWSSNRLGRPRGARRKDEARNRNESGAAAAEAAEAAVAAWQCVDASKTKEKKSRAHSCSRLRGKKEKRNLLKKSN